MSNKMDNKINLTKQIFISSGTQKVLDYLINQNDWRTVGDIRKNISLSPLLGFIYCLHQNSLIR